MKAAKKAKLAKIKEMQAQIKGEGAGQSDNSRLQPSEKEDDLDATIKEGLRQVNRGLMKKDDRFKGVIGKIGKIKKKAENVKANMEKEHKKSKKKKVSVK